MKNKEKTTKKPEFIRKFLVSLKRNPQFIPGALLVISFLVYSLNLTKVSNTLTMVQGKMMGFCEFVTMLLSILVFVCFMNSYPKRQRPNIGFIILTYVMLAIIVVCDVSFRNGIYTAVTKAENKIVINDATMYIMESYNMLFLHIIFIIVTAVLNATMPVYGKLLKKINTSIDVDGNEDMATIEISED
ncbi:MAG: hypothetical protein K6B75_05560 [Lachnospiraceae bacterium]|nr:hypothetical protein [Lachnospiraceae bacterium]